MQPNHLLEFFSSTILSSVFYFFVKLSPISRYKSSAIHKIIIAKIAYIQEIWKYHLGFESLLGLFVLDCNFVQFIFLCNVLIASRSGFDDQRCDLDPVGCLEIEQIFLFASKKFNRS